MKFKVIFLLFNAILVGAFLFLFFMPLAVIGLDETMKFWGQNWYIGLIFISIMAVLNVFFFRNRQLYQYLEREDWAGLTAWIDSRVQAGKGYGEQELRLLANGLVIQGRTQELRRIEAKVRQDKPDLFQRLAIIFGIPYILDQNGDAMKGFFQQIVDSSPRHPDAEWLRFFLAFGHLAARDTAAALPLLEALSREAKDPVVRLLATYLRYSRTGDDGSQARSDLQKRWTREKMDRLVDRRKDELQVILLLKFITEASEWTWKVGESA